MECDTFYDTHPPYNGTGDRCSRDEIAAGTATQFSILGMSTTLCGTFCCCCCCCYCPVDEADVGSDCYRNAEPLRRRLGRQKVWPSRRAHGPDVCARHPRRDPDYWRRRGEAGRHDHHPVHAAHHHPRRARGYMYAKDLPSPPFEAIASTAANCKPAASSSTSSPAKSSSRRAALPSSACCRAASCSDRVLGT